MSLASKASLPSVVTLPDAGSTRRLVPSLPISRSLSALGLKSTVAATPAGSMASSMTFGVATPVAASSVTSQPSGVTP